MFDSGTLSHLKNKSFSLFSGSSFAPAVIMMKERYMVDRSECRGSGFSIFVFHWLKFLAVFFFSFSLSINLVGFLIYFCFVLEYFCVLLHLSNRFSPWLYG